MYRGIMDCIREGSDQISYKRQTKIAKLGDGSETARDACLWTWWAHYFGWLSTAKVHGQSIKILWKRTVIFKSDSQAEEPIWVQEAMVKDGFINKPPWHPRGQIFLFWNATRCHFHSMVRRSFGSKNGVQISLNVTFYGKVGQWIYPNVKLKTSIVMAASLSCQFIKRFVE